MRRRRRRSVRFRPRVAQVAAAAAVGGIVFGAITLSSGATVGPAASAAAMTNVVITAADQDPDHLNAPFPDLAVTISQTAELEQQAIRISWTGGIGPSTPGGSALGGRNFLQVFQCWGDVAPGQPGYIAGTPRPDRTTCQYGSTGNSGSSRVAGRTNASVIAPEDEVFSVPPNPPVEPAWITAIPFVAANGTAVDKIRTSGCPAFGGNPAPPKCLDPAIPLDQNQFFTRLTTNEVPWVGFDANGEGSIAFEVQTAAQAPGLGCGNPLTQPDHSVVGRSCWLVILPRGIADNGAPEINSFTSGLFWDSWKHALAVKLEFRPLGSVCPEGTSEKLLQGSELIAGAVHSWQPVVCNEPGGNVYSLIVANEADALLAQANQSASNPPLALTARALQASSDPLQYAPIGLTGISVVFAINQNPRSTGIVPPEITAAVTQPVMSMKLTPRLLAKLLTYSYRGSLPSDADRSHLGANPTNLTLDPDFLAVNADSAFWQYQSLNGIGLTDLFISQGRSDAAWLVWSYIISDQEARDWLAGGDDGYGMRVNPWFSSNKDINPTGTGLTYPRDDFPKADPIEWAGPTVQQNINLVTWRPYVNDLEQSGYLTLRGDAQAISGWDPLALPPRYARTGRSLPGFQQVLGLSDSSVANRFQLVTASLRNAAGQFVAPTDAAIAAAAAAMTPAGGKGQVVRYDPASAQAAATPDAYPLSTPVYAAANRALTDPVLRLQYAQFIKYAAGSGQTPGLSIGQLPPGYAPLPAAWAQQASAAADAIAAGPPPLGVPNTSRGNPGNQPRTGGVTLSTAPIAQPAPDPLAEGAVVTQLTGPETPEDPPTPATQVAVPVSVAAGAAAGLAFPFLSRRRPL